MYDEIRWNPAVESITVVWLITEANNPSCPLCSYIDRSRVW